jgi:hypothetical protein
MNDIEKYDIRQAGKCLAYEVPTAAGFHLLRAADSVLRRYHRQLTRKELPARAWSWGIYIKGLAAAGADPRVVSALEQVKNLHRNPSSIPISRYLLPVRKPG